MCVYDMLNESCKKHKDWGNYHVSVSDIGTETASVPYLDHRVYRKVKSKYETHTASPAPVKRRYIFVG